ncbi:hypothetical protein [uncultured Serinicoccus sp.]|uniref:hypothetical protein n=1 Tax=uncultured Serinicoccus sp. TaxID=735514 RepID=UPI002617D6F6|nr:hypothetical protein [uncultured Serinicoccus sp.]
MPRPRLKDRIFTALTTLAAVVVLIVGLSRGNTRVAVLGAGFFLGYAVLQSVSRRLEPAARLMTGSEADRSEALGQFRATRLAAQGGLAIALVAAVLDVTLGWTPGLWVAGTVLAVLALFVGGLWWFSRGARGR